MVWTLLLCLQIGLTPGKTLAVDLGRAAARTSFDPLHALPGINPKAGVTSGECKDGTCAGGGSHLSLTTSGSHSGSDGASDEAQHAGGVGETPTVVGPVEIIPWVIRCKAGNAPAAGLGDAPFRRR